MTKSQKNTSIERSRLRFKRLRDYADAIVQTVRDPLVVLDPNLKIKSVNQAFCDTFQITAPMTKNRHIYDLRPGEWKFKNLKPLLQELLAQDNDAPQCEVNSHFTGQSNRSMLLSARKITGVNPDKPLILVSIEDISDRKLQQHAFEKLIKSFKHDSMTDALTELHNRRGFLTLGAQFLRIGHRMGRGVFVLFADVDGLKRINDEKGHEGGDIALKQAAEILRKTFRQSDIVARIGGDEFAIVTLEQLPGSINAIMARFKRHCSKPGDAGVLSLSVGVAYSGASETLSIEELLAKADAIMYIEKQNMQKVLASVPSDPTYVSNP